MNGYHPNFLTALSSANVLTDNMCIVWANSNFLITFLHNYILFTLHRHSAQSMSNVLSVIQKRGWYEFNKVLCDRRDSLLTCTCSCGKHLSTGSYPYQFLDQHLLEEKGFLITNTMIYMCNPTRKKFFFKICAPNLLNLCFIFLNLWKNFK